MKKLLLFVIGLFACLFANCTRFDEPVPVREAESEALTGPIRTRSIGTGFDSLPDPYALENMQAVYDAYDVDVVLEPTDLYVRIMPQDSTQLELLEDICGLDLFDYPLDRDVA